MRLLLIRHGETVDNVAQVYAGSRDSELTNHGHQQATRLGAHLTDLGLVFTHIFSSHLQRAYKTAGLIRDAQLAKVEVRDIAVPDVVRLPILMEKDFGSYEGRRWKKGSNDAVIEETDFMAMESKESVARRMNSFLETHLFPLLDAGTSQHPVIAIVSHGIVLSVLWRRLLARLPPKSVSLSPELATGFAAVSDFSFERLGDWPNTGYLELELQTVFPSQSRPAPDTNMVASVPTSSDLNHANVDRVARSSASPPTSSIITDLSVTKYAVVQASQPSNSRSSPLLEPLLGLSTTIVTIHGRNHLKGLKRTRGGVGSTKHDTTQKSIDNFFKRRRTE